MAEHRGGSNCDVVIADAYFKGLKNIDYEKGLASMIKNATVPPGDDERKEGRGGLPDYNTLGYVSTNYERAGTRTVEYAYNDFCIAEMAKAMGKDSLAKIYYEKSNNWKNLWNPDIESEGAKGFIWPRHEDGSWQEDFNVHKSGTWPDFFYESHSWEYSLYVPQDVNGLIEACGGNEKFIQRLDTFFIKESYTQTPWLNDYYNVTNEPGFLTPTLYNWAGRPDKTSETVRRIIADEYNATPAGLPGNDDAGSMSAWFAFHAMGFYPVAGQDLYLITAPHFEEVTIQLEENVSFTIIANGLNDKNIYVQSASLNGKPLNKSWFTHTEIKNGGNLTLKMGAEPSEWATIP